MDQNETNDVRIRELEREIVDLKSRLARLEPRPSRPATERFARAIEHRRAAWWSVRAEQWTGRIGLALLFLGLVFLFRYSVQHGWITPIVRVAFGAGLGATFLTIGLRTSRLRPSYGAILLAGAIACFYATGWAASYLYLLIERPTAFLWMGGVTLLAFWLAGRQSQPALASLGAIGGFATPFLLGPAAASVLELVTYATLVVLWTAPLYVRRGWHSVLWTYVAGGLAVVAVAGLRAADAELWLVQFALVVVWLAGSALPFIHEYRSAGDRDPRPRELLPYAIQLRLLGVGGTAATLAITTRVWELGDSTSGVLFIAIACLYGAFAWIGTRSPNFVARSAAPVAAALLATGAFLIAGDTAARWGAVGVIGAVSLWSGASRRFDGLEWVGHGLFALLAVEVVRFSFWAESAAFGATAWALMIAAALGLAGAQYLRSGRVRFVYQCGVHLVTLLWLADQFSALSTNAEWVTVAWGAYGTVLLLIALELGRRRDEHLLRTQAFAGTALLLVVAKLLVVDMAQVSPLVRIPMFLGVGAALIAVSSRFQVPAALASSSGARSKASAATN